MYVYQGIVRNDEGVIIVVSDVYQHLNSAEKWKKNILDCFTSILEHNITVSKMELKKKFN